LKKGRKTLKKDLASRIQKSVTKSIFEKHEKLTVSSHIPMKNMVL